MGAMRRRSRHLLAVVGLGVVVVPLGGCGVTGESASDGPVYESVEALAVDAELVVLGAVGNVRGSEVDDGGNEDGTGVDVTFHDFVVAEVLATAVAGSRSVTPGDALAVGVTQDSVRLVEGEEMVLFLEQLTPDDAPGIDTEDVFYVAIGMEGDGAFDVQDGAVVARSERVNRLAAADEPASTLFTTSLGDLRRFLAR